MNLASTPVVVWSATTRSALARGHRAGCHLADVVLEKRREVAQSDDSALG